LASEQGGSYTAIAEIPMLFVDALAIGNRLLKVFNTTGSAIQNLNGAQL
jgi:hypothetical protein